MAMNYMGQSQKNISKSYIDLEDQIFAKISSDYRFKDILYPFVVLDRDENRVVLGSSKETVNKVSYNFSLESAMQEIVGAIINDKLINIVFKIAEDEALVVKKRIDKKSAQKKQQESILPEIEEQKRDGKCNLIPFPIKDNKVRSDLSVERHAIFAANTFKGDFRSYERKLKDPQTGENFTLRIEVGDKKIRGLGVLKQKHQEAFYKLSQIWSQQNYYIEEEEKTVFGSLELSIYDLVQKLRGDDAGHHYQSTMQLLREMAAIRVCIKKINLEDDTCDIQDFTLLSYGINATQFSEKTLKTKPGGTSKVNIRFSNFVTDNFLKKNIKALMLGPYLSLEDKGRKGVAQLLYTMLDYELATKDKFNISLINLCNRLGLAQCKYKSERKRKLESSVKSIFGQKILDSKYEIAVYLEESEDGEDWIFIARRKPL